MKTQATLAILILLICTFGCDSGKKVADAKNQNSSNVNTVIKDEIVEVSCGQCQFDMEGKGCDLAIRIDDKSYYVDGSNIDDHGDAHAKYGLCNCIQKARVSGEIIDGRFQVSSIELVKSKEKQNASKQ